MMMMMMTRSNGWDTGPPQSGKGSSRPKRAGEERRCRELTDTPQRVDAVHEKAEIEEMAAQVAGAV